MDEETANPLEGDPQEPQRAQDNNGHDGGSRGDDSSQVEVFSIELEEEQGVPVVAASGELDIYSAPRLRALLAEAMSRAGGPRSGPRSDVSSGAPSVIVDLSEVTFADSMTLGVLIGERSSLKELGGDLYLVLGDGAVARLLKHAGLEKGFKSHPDRASAATEIQGG